MNQVINSIIVGTGSYLPDRKISNRDFLSNDFYDQQGTKFPKSNEEIVRKLEEITSISERRYVGDNQVASDIALLAAQSALESSGIDKEKLDYIIVAHNFGDVRANNKRSDFVPSLAARVKHRLGIKNPRAIAYDLPFGCPGWLQGMIQANYFLKSGDAELALIIGAETLSRISDPHDRDSMIYADGAGATIIKAVKGSRPVGILSHATRSDTYEHAYMLRMGKSNSPHTRNGDLYLKMDGHKLYEYAVKTVPLVVKECLEKAEVTIDDIDTILIHQANAKLDEAILRRVYKLNGDKKIPANIMPMTIAQLGNSSVATLPTLLDMLRKEELDGYRMKSHNHIVFASVGAGMNINSLVYRVP